MSNGTSFHIACHTFVLVVEQLLGVCQYGHSIIKYLITSNVRHPVDKLFLTPPSYKYSIEE